MANAQDDAASIEIFLATFRPDLKDRSVCDAVFDVLEEFPELHPHRYGCDAWYRPRLFRIHDRDRLFEAWRSPKHSVSAWEQTLAEPQLCLSHGHGSGHWLMLSTGPDFCTDRQEWERL